MTAFSSETTWLVNQPLWKKVAIFAVLAITIFVAWPLAVASIYGLVVLRTINSPKTRLALVAAMIVPALIMEATWGQVLIASVTGSDKDTSTQTASLNTSPPSSTKQVQGATTANPSSPRVTAKVLQAVSGDTLDVDRDGQPYRVKLIGLTAPHMPDRSVGQAECFGPESQMFLDSLLRGRQVELVEDKLLEQGSASDLWRYVIMDDGTKVNQLMIEAGLARLNDQDHEYSAEYKAFAESARLAKKGLWLNCDKQSTKPSASPTPTANTSVNQTLTPSISPTPTFVNPTPVQPVSQM